jgi:hypothetical protein
VKTEIPMAMLALQLVKVVQHPNLKTEQEKFRNNYNTQQYTF